MTAEFDWTPVAENAWIEHVPETINRALAVLADLLLDVNHACTFTLVKGPLMGDVITSVNALLPPGCRVSELDRVDSWRGLLTERLPVQFVPDWEIEDGQMTWRRGPWVDGTPARRLAEGLTTWIVALLERLWPDAAPAFRVYVDCDDWYEMYYVDLAVRVGNEISLLHLGVSD